MYRRAYILTFDRDDVRDYRTLHESIVNLPSVITWWHYIKSSYILIANTNNATVLKQEIKDVMPGKRFLLVEVNIKNRNGWLPQEAWDWLKTQSEKLR